MRRVIGTLMGLGLLICLPAICCAGRVVGRLQATRLRAKAKGGAHG